MNTFALDLLNMASKNGGWTVSMHGMHTPVHGYSVGGDPDIPEWQIPGWRNIPGPVTAQILSDYLIVIEWAHGMYTGGWEKDGTLYLDSPTRVDHLGDAVSLGRERGELAIYDLRNDEVITL